MPENLLLVDTHAHLEEVPDLDSALARARVAGVRAIIAVGSDLASSQRALEISRDHPGFVFPALGIHPTSLGEEAVFRFMEENLDKAVAIGEVGLDYKVAGPGDLRETQKRAFARCLEMARARRKPVLVHARGAWADAFDLVKRSGVEKVVFHWFSGPPEVLKGIVASGYFVSATPAVEYSHGHRSAVQHVPLPQLLLETDSPVRYRGRDSEPADVVRVLREVARLKGMEEAELARITTTNALAFFQIRTPGHNSVPPVQGSP
jgi:TatD DNase family protein